MHNQYYWELSHRVNVCRCRRFYAADADKVYDGSHNLLTGATHPGFTSVAVIGYNLTVALAAVAWHYPTISYCVFCPYRRIPDVCSAGRTSGFFCGAAGVKVPVSGKLILIILMHLQSRIST